MVNFQRAIFIRPGLVKSFKKLTGAKIPGGWYRPRKGFPGKGRILMTSRDPKLLLHEIGHKIQEPWLTKKGFDYGPHQRFEEDLAERHAGKGVLRFKTFLTKLLGRRKYNKLAKSVFYKTPVRKRVIPIGKGLSGKPGSKSLINALKNKGSIFG